MKLLRLEIGAAVDEFASAVLGLADKSDADRSRRLKPWNVCGGPATALLGLTPTLAGVDP